MSYQKRVCIITPDIIGPIKNGGIGTHCFYLAKFLAKDMRQDVTILFTSNFEIESVEYWRKWYKAEYGIQFIAESELSEFFEGDAYCSPWFIQRSQKIYAWLKEQDFEVCYFQEWHANGFISIQAKRTGISFQNTALVCMTHSSSEWIREGMKLLPSQGLDELMLDYAERYCIEFADYAISPSHAMFSWAKDHQWRIACKTAILPYLFETPFKPVNSLFAGEELIFFGRLETRKGLEVFLKSLQILAPQLKSLDKVLKLNFLGKNGTTEYGTGNQAIHQLLSKYSDVYRYKIFNDLSQPEALSFLSEHADALVVAPSLVDNLPYAVLECVELNINLITANTGGIPEMFADNSRLFIPTPKTLAEKIWTCITDGLPPLKKQYSSESSKALWRDFSEEISVEDFQQNISSTNSPLVSICIPYYNCGDFLPDALRSIALQTYENFEVIVVDDGSTDEFSLSVFAEMQQEYRDRRWIFLKKENGGPGSARNLAASKATGEYLVFMDSDNAAERDMLRKMAVGMNASGADCLSSYYRVFDEFHSPFSKVYKSACFVLGACLEGNFYTNILGDTNFIIKSDTFLQLGGFRESQTIGHEDREFLAKLLVQGYSLDTIPEFLFLYRHRGGSFNQTTHDYDNWMAGINPLLEIMPDWNKRYIMNTLGTIQSLAKHNYLNSNVSLLNSELMQSQQALARKQEKVQQIKVRLEVFKKRVAELEAALAESKDTASNATARIIAMETSKFWRLRQSWFRIKKILNLPTNE